MIAFGKDRPDIKAGGDHGKGQEGEGYLAPVLDDQSQRHHTSPWYFADRLKIARGYSLTAS